MKNLELPDGTMVVKIQGGPKGGTSVDVDVISAKLVNEAAEKKFDVKEGWIPTAEFLRALADGYVGGGVIEYCTPSMAYHLYFAITDAWNDLKKSMSSDADSSSTSEAPPSKLTEKPLPV